MFLIKSLTNEQKKKLYPFVMVKRGKKTIIKKEEIEKEEKAVEGAMEELDEYKFEGVH